MDQPTKRQKVEDTTLKSSKVKHVCVAEVVLFNSDTLSKIISYLPSVDALNLAITSKRFGISNDEGEQSLIEESARIAVQGLATEEQLAALPHYEGESSLADYHYLQLMRAPLTFDQLVGRAEYVDHEDKSCVIGRGSSWVTAISNNILRAGKHYVSFKLLFSLGCFVGLMRPGQSNENASGCPFNKVFYQNFTQRFLSNNENNIMCCMYSTQIRFCISSRWPGPYFDGSRSQITEDWEGMEKAVSGDDIGMLLDLDEGTLSVYKNGRKLGVMKSGLAGPYCWAVSMMNNTQVMIKRGMVPS